MQLEHENLWFYPQHVRLDLKYISKVLSDLKSQIFIDDTGTHERNREFGLELL